MPQCVWPICLLLFTVFCLLFTGVPQNTDQCRKILKVPVRGGLFSSCRMEPAGRDLPLLPILGDAQRAALIMIGRMTGASGIRTGAERDRSDVFG